MEYKISINFEKENIKNLPRYQANNNQRMNMVISTRRLLVMLKLIRDEENNSITVGWGIQGKNNGNTSSIHV